MLDLEKKILKDIIQGTLAPGTKISIKEMCERYSAGHIPIREALFQLLQTKLIEKLENRGFRIKPLIEKEVRDIHKTFIEIEQLVLIKAIENGSEKWMNNVMSKLEALAEVENNDRVIFAKWEPCNTAFHKSLVEGCGSECLVDIRNTLADQFSRYMRIGNNYDKDFIIVNHEIHRELVKVIFERNVEKTCKLIYAHMSGPFEHILKNLRDRGFLQ